MQTIRGVGGAISGVGVTATPPEQQKAAAADAAAVPPYASQHPVCVWGTSGGGAAAAVAMTQAVPRRALAQCIIVALLTQHSIDVWGKDPGVHFQVFVNTRLYLRAFGFSPVQHSSHRQVLAGIGHVALLPQRHFFSCDVAFCGEATFGHVVDICL